MSLRKRTTAPMRWVLSVISLSCWVLSAQAQSLGASGTPMLSSLKDVFDTAWQRQPEAHALQSRREAAQANAKAAQLLSPEPASLELSQRTDRMNGNSGARENEVGIAVPIWLPGQRSASADLAQVEISLVERKLLSSQLRIASATREAWWGWQRALVDVELAQAQLANARRLATDVARRTQAGDLAKADQHQAEGAVATAEALAAQAKAALADALAKLVALVGSRPASDSSVMANSEPLPGQDTPGEHPALAEMQDRIAMAERTVNLVNTLRRANPELTVATTRARGAFGERYGQTVLVGVRLPFGAGPRHDARVATAQAEALEVQSQLTLERDRLLAEQQSAALRVEAARTQLDAAQRRAQLAQESRGFFDKSFRLGETDLPTRLRIEAEAVEAQRLEARSRIDLAAAISSWRQSMGLLPQ